MAHAADAFIRVTGEIAVASGTEGPGFTDMICAIACANAARTPLLIVASNMSIGAEDTEGGIQLGYQQPTTEGLKKYGKRLIIPRRVHEYAAYAFRQLRSGVPKPVHLDFPAEVASARFKDATELEYFFDKAREYHRVREVLESLDIAGKADAYPHELSFGQAQRVAVARAVVNRPRLLLADEPTSNLDDERCAQAYALLESQARACGATLVIATHDHRIKARMSNQFELKTRT